MVPVRLLLPFVYTSSSAWASSTGMPSASSTRRRMPGRPAFGTLFSMQRVMTPLRVEASTHREPSVRRHPHPKIGGVLLQLRRCRHEGIAQIAEPEICRDAADVLAHLEHTLLDPQRGLLLVHLVDPAHLVGHLAALALRGQAGLDGSCPSPARTLPAGRPRAGSLRPGRNTRSCTVRWGHPWRPACRQSKNTGWCPCPDTLPARCTAGP